MNRLLGRYLLRETIQTWLIVTVVLLLILVTNQFASVLGDAAANKLPREAVFEVMGLTSAQYLTILVPVGLFLAIMLALARLYHDSEMAAMMACGVGPAQQYRPLLLLAGTLAVAVGFLAMVVAPDAAQRIGALAEAAKRNASLAALDPGRFLSLGESGAVLYAGSVTADQHLHDVFVQRQDGERVEVILADEAWQTPPVADGSRVLVFARGKRYEGVPGRRDFRLVEFAEYGIPYAVPPARGGKTDPEAKPTRELLASVDLADRAELHWRLSVPLTLLVLTVIAVPLAKTGPRQGRFSGLATAVLIYVIYANLLAAGRGWIERGQVPEWVGLWWVHALFLLTAGLMLLAQQGLLRRLSRRFPWRTQAAVT